MSDFEATPERYSSENGYTTDQLIYTATQYLNGSAAFYTGCMIKYAARWWRKDGIIDLKKCIDYSQAIAKNPMHKPQLDVNKINQFRFVGYNHICNIARDFGSTLYHTYNVPHTNHDLAVLAAYTDRLIIDSCTWWMFDNVEHVENLCNEMIEFVR